MGIRRERGRGFTIATPEIWILVALPIRQTGIHVAESFVFRTVLLLYARLGMGDTVIGKINK